MSYLNSVVLIIFIYYEDTPSLLTDACTWIESPSVVAWNHWVAGLTGPAGQSVQSTYNYVYFFILNVLA